MPFSFVSFGFPFAGLAALSAVGWLFCFWCFGFYAAVVGMIFRLFSRYLWLSGFSFGVCCCFVGHRLLAVCCCWCLVLLVLVALVFCWRGSFFMVLSFPC